MYRALSVGSSNEKLLTRCNQMATITLKRAFMPKASYLIAGVDDSSTVPQPTMHSPQCIANAFGVPPPTKAEMLATNGCILYSDALCANNLSDGLNSVIRGGSLQGIPESGNAISLNHCCPQARCGDAYGYPNPETMYNWRNGCNPLQRTVRERPSDAMLD